MLDRNLPSRLRPRGDLKHLLAVWLPRFTGLVAWLLYARRSAPGIMSFFNDSLEFHVVVPVFGIAHPTGYPLYTLAAGLWTHVIPLGTWAGRVNLFSAVVAAITVGLLVKLAGRLTTTPDGHANLWAGMTAVVVFGLSPLWVSQAILAEVYALHNLFVVAILLTAVGINRTLDERTSGAISAPPYPPAFNRRMLCLLAVIGLSLAHHRTTVLLLPPIVLYLLWSVPGLWRPTRQWWGWAGVLLAPLLLYLYLPIRAWMGTPDIHGGYVNSWAGFWHHVAASNFTTFFAENSIDAGYAWRDWAALLRDQVGWIALSAMLLGLAWLFDRRGRPARAWWLILAVLLVNAAFVWRYRVPDPEVFALPVLLCLALFAGGGVGLLARLLPVRWALPAQAIALLAIVVVPAGRAPLPDLNDMWRYHDRARLMTLAEFPPDSRVVGIEGEMTALRYMQVAEGRAQDVTLIAADDPAERMAQIDAALAADAPIYLTRELDGVADRYSYDGAGLLIRMHRRFEPGIADNSNVQTVPVEAAVTPPIAVGDGALTIEGHTIRRVDTTAQPYAELTLYWRKVAPVEAKLKVSLRAFDASGAPLLWPDGTQVSTDEFPLRRLARTPDWPIDDLIRDVYYLQLPETISPESHRLLVIIYDEATGDEVARTEIMF